VTFRQRFRSGGSNHSIGTVSSRSGATAGNPTNPNLDDSPRGESDESPRGEPDAERRLMCVNTGLVGPVVV
jgi:hypothetical protein